MGCHWSSHVSSIYLGMGHWSLELTTKLWLLHDCGCIAGQMCYFSRKLSSSCAWTSLLNFLFTFTTNVATASYSLGVVICLWSITLQSKCNMDPYCSWILDSLLLPRSNEALYKSWWGQHSQFSYTHPLEICLAHLTLWSIYAILPLKYKIYLSVFLMKILYCTMPHS